MKIPRTRKQIAQSQTPAVTINSAQSAVSSTTSISLGRCGSRMSQLWLRENNDSIDQALSPAKITVATIMMDPIAICRIMRASLAISASPRAGLRSSAAMPRHPRP